MKITRRGFVQAGIGATAAGLLPAGHVHAAIEMGPMRIDSVSDGNLVLPAEFIFAPVPQDVAATVRAVHGLEGDMLTPPCNLTLLRHEGRTVLFDAGSGPSFQPSAGTLLDGLDALGVAPGDVTHVVFTHGHPDHLWGVLDDFDEPLFFEAEHLIGRAEFDYWADPATVDTIGAERQSFAVGAARRLAALAERFSFFEDGDEVLPGVQAVASYGHTPGHMAFELRAGSEALLVAGDAIGNDHLAFDRPDVPAGADQDMETAAATRAALFDRIMAEDMAILGFHLGKGGIGRVDRQGDGYVFRPGET